jgi:hypothetical protein
MPTYRGPFAASLTILRDILFMLPRLLSATRFELIKLLGELVFSLGPYYKCIALRANKTSRKPGVLLRMTVI